MICERCWLLATYVLARPPPCLSAFPSLALPPPAPPITASEDSSHFSHLSTTRAAAVILPLAQSASSGALRIHDGSFFLKTRGTVKNGLVLPKNRQYSL